MRILESDSSADLEESLLEEMGGTLATKLQVCVDPDPDPTRIHTVGLQ